MKAWLKLALYKKILVTLVLGAVLGFIVGPSIKVVSFIGDMYIASLKMLVVPLVFFSIVSGVAKLADPKEFARLGGSVLSYYVLTTIFAAIAGVLIALVVQPGSDAVGILGLHTQVKYQEYNLGKTLVSWIPSNVVMSMSKMDMIPVIVFAVLYGLCLVMIKEKNKPMMAFFESGNEAMLKMTELVAEASPYGIFFLAAQLTGTIGGKMLVVGLKFALAVYCGHVVMLLLVYPTLLTILGKLSPLRFYKNIFPVMAMAAGTCSSNATLPISMNCAEYRCGIDKRLFSFSLPLGATVNMDGFSVALGIIAVTALELYAVPITPLVIFKAVFLGLMISIGAPGVKGTAVVMSAVLFQSLGLPMGMLPLIGAIWPLVDIGNTTVNVTGDLVGTSIVANRLHIMDKDVFDKVKTDKN